MRQFFDSELINTPFGEVSIVKAFPGTDAVMLLGGSNQDPIRVKANQQLLAEQYDISSAAIGIFDANISSIQTIETPLGLPEPMIKKALALLELSNGILSKHFRALDKVLAHCAGSNVFLVAKHLERMRGDRVLPSNGVLAEPMLKEKVTPLDYGRFASRHEKAYRNGDTSRISLRELGPPDLVLDTEVRKAQMQEIIGSKGITLFKKALDRGDNYKIIFGRDDYASPMDEIVEELDATGVYTPNVVTEYRMDRVRTGHGFFFAEPEIALKSIVPLLKNF